MPGRTRETQGTFDTFFGARTEGLGSKFYLETAKFRREPVLKMIGKSLAGDLLLAAAVMAAWAWSPVLSGEPASEAEAITPLISTAEAEAVEAEHRRTWERAAADSALRMGLGNIAIGFYDHLLEEADVADAVRHEMELNRITAFISLGRLEEAKAALGEYRGMRASRFYLRQALVGYFLGDEKAAGAALELVDGEALLGEEMAWGFLIRGLLQRKTREEEGDAFLERARQAAVSTEQRAQIDLIIYRTSLLESGRISPGQLKLLQEEMDSQILQGNRLGFQFAKQYAVALNAAGRPEEAVESIRETLPLILEVDYDLRDELLLLQGILSGRTTEDGRDAFRRLLSTGVTTDLRLHALHSLVASAITPEDIDAFLFYTNELPLAGLPGVLKDQVLYSRAQLLYRIKDYDGSENECQTLLAENPETELRESTLRLLVLIAFQRQRYRTAAGFLIQLGELVATESERNRIQLLVADCFFLAEDYRNAADSYGVAIEQDQSDRGVILFQWVLSEIKAGNYKKAIEHMGAFKEDDSVDPVQKWRALWNLLSAMQRVGEDSEAYHLLSEWLTRESKEALPVSLWVRLLWLRCQLTLKTGRYDATPAVAGEVYRALSEAKGQLDEGLGIDITSLTQVMESQALVFSGREEEGMELLAAVRRDFPGTRAAVQSIFAEARYFASRNLMVDAQQRLIQLADTYPESELAPVALYEAALHALTRGTDSTMREASLIFERMADHYSEHPLVFYGRLNQGNLLRSFNDFGGAEQVFEQLLITFPGHKDSAVVLMAQAECILAQTDTSLVRIDQAIGKFERLAELPDLPIDLRVEAAWKWAFAYQRRNNPERVIQIYWLTINQFLIEEDHARELGPTGRYWMSRIVISLGEALEGKGDLESARRVYALIAERGLPFQSLAEGKLGRMGQTQG